MGEEATPFGRRVERFECARRTMTDVESSPDNPKRFGRGTVRDSSWSRRTVTTQVPAAQSAVEKFVDEQGVGFGAHAEAVEFELFVGRVDAIIIEAKAHENGFESQFGLEESADRD